MNSGAPLVFIVIGLVVVLAVSLWRTRTTHFDCPNCGRSCKVSASEYFLSQVVLSRMKTDRSVTCPYCHASVPMTPLPDRTQ